MRTRPPTSALAAGSREEVLGVVGNDGGRFIGAILGRSVGDLVVQCLGRVVVLCAIEATQPLGS